MSKSRCCPTLLLPDAHKLPGVGHSLRRHLSCEQHSFRPATICYLSSACSQVQKRTTRSATIFCLSSACLQTEWRTVCRLQRLRHRALHVPRHHDSRLSILKSNSHCRGFYADSSIEGVQLPKLQQPAEAEPHFEVAALIVFGVGIYKSVAVHCRQQQQLTW